jgi:formate hydrogenlyase subunit 4
MISISGLLGQAFAILLALVLAPLLSGWVGQCRAWFQSRTAPPLLLPYYMLQKLFNKDVVLAHNASSLFRAAPFVIFGCMVLACAIVPTLSTDLPFAPAADALALVGVFGLARIFISLAGMDVGTSFGTLGGRREMLVGFLAEPALLMVIFTLAMIAQSTSLATIVETLAHRELVIYPSLAFAGVAFTIVSLAENARVPVDNPATHLELTMIHEAMILEYSGRHLALIEWAASLKLYAYSCLGLALFFPWGIAPATASSALLAAIPLLLLKLAIGGACWPASRPSTPRCASSARRNSSAPPSCSRCSACWSACCWRSRYERIDSVLGPADQPVRGGDPAAGLRHAGAAPHAGADQPVRPAGPGPVPGDPGRGGDHRPGAPVLLGRADAGAQGAAAALDPAPPGAPAQRQAAKSRP